MPLLSALIMLSLMAQQVKNMRWASGAAWIRCHCSGVITLSKSEKSTGATCSTSIPILPVLVKAQMTISPEWERLKSTASLM